MSLLVLQAEPVKSSSFVRDGDASVAHLADYIAGIYKDVERTAPNAAAS